jgi:hypothetical protein
MTPPDRAALADALATATPEMLRADAEWLDGLIKSYRHSDNNGAVPAWSRLAALALACADLEENGRSIAFFGKPVRWDRVEIDGDDVDCAAQGPTLAAALAALIRKG